MINYKYNKYSLLFKSVFKRKEAIISYPLNILYWLIKPFKDIFKWIYAISLFKKNKALFFLLFLSPFFKFIFISLGSLYRFKKNFYSLLYLMLFILILLLIECFCELPIHIIFPLNKIYIHTNYYRIYDLRERASFNINIEIIENFILLLYSIIYFTAGKFHYSAVIILIFSFLNICFFIYAKLFYCLFNTVVKKENNNNEILTLENSKEFNKLEDKENKVNIKYLNAIKNFESIKDIDNNNIPTNFYIDSKSKIQLDDIKTSSSSSKRNIKEIE